MNHPIGPSQKTLAAVSIQPANGGPIPASVVRKSDVLYAVVALAALLLAAAGAAIIRSRRKPEIRRLLDPHVQRPSEARAVKERKARLEPLFQWTEDALEDLRKYKINVDRLPLKKVKIRKR